MTKENEKRVRSLSDRLKNLSKKLAIPFETLLPYFLLERLAVRLVSDPTLATKLVFKGGFIGLRVYDSPRVTVDLDALLKSGDLKTIQKSVVERAEANSEDGVWFRFQSTQDLQTLGEYGGLRILFRCGIGDIPKQIPRARILNLDIGVGDPVVPAARKATTAFLLGDGELSWSVYPIETICSEKLHTLIARGSTNSRAKDVFDLNLFLPKCDSAQLRKSLAATFKYRGDELPEDFVKALREIDTRILKTGWKSAVSGLSEATGFDEAFENLLKLLPKVL